MAVITDGCGDPVQGSLPTPEGTTMLYCPVLVLALVPARDLPTGFVLPPAPGAFRSGKEPGADEISFRSGVPLLVTSYFYWYDDETRGHLVNHDGSDALTDHPPTLKGFSYKSVDWHARQLADMIAAGIDVLLPVYW
jgi:hypothetical protein